MDNTICTLTFPEQPSLLTKKYKYKIFFTFVLLIPSQITGSLTRVWWRDSGARPRVATPPGAPAAASTSPPPAPASSPSQPRRTSRPTPQPPPPHPCPRGSPSSLSSMWPLGSMPGRWASECEQHCDLCSLFMFYAFWKRWSNL